MRLLRSILTTWKPGQYESTQNKLIEYFYHLLGRVLILSNIPFDCLEPMSNKRRIKMYTSQTASISSTVAEECIVLIRKLHPLPSWRKTINCFIGNALQGIPNLVLQSEFSSQEKMQQVLEKQVFLVM